MLFEIVLEALPQEAWQEAEGWSNKADLFVVIGSSLVVSPANLLPQIAVQAGAKLLIINQEPTPLDHLATWFLQEKAAETLPAIVVELNRRLSHATGNHPQRYHQSSR